MKYFIIALFLLASMVNAQTFTWNDDMSKSSVTFYLCNGDTCVKGELYRSDGTFRGGDLNKDQFCSWMLETFTSDTTSISTKNEEIRDIEAKIRWYQKKITKLTVQKGLIEKEKNEVVYERNLLIRMHNGIKQHLDCLTE